jgi:hypothetical protein
MQLQSAGEHRQQACLIALATVTSQGTPWDSQDAPNRRLRLLSVLQGMLVV